MNEPSESSAFDRAGLAPILPDAPYIPGGQQAIARLYRCRVIPENSSAVHSMARSAVDAMRAHVIDLCAGHGTASGKPVFSSAHGLEESSAFAHFMPDPHEDERDGLTGTVDADIFTCGDDVDPFVGIQYLQKIFNAERVDVLYRGRGKKDMSSLQMILDTEGIVYASTDGDSLLQSVDMD